MINIDDCKGPKSLSGQSRALLVEEMGQDHSRAKVARDLHRYGLQGPPRFAKARLYRLLRGGALLL